MRRLRLHETTPDAWNEILDVNLRALFFVAQGAAPHLRAERGRLVNIADLAGLEPWPAYAAHSISKAGVVMLTEVLARELAPEVTVNAVAPGAVLVPDEYDAVQRDALASTTPLGRLGGPSDVVDAVLYLIERGDYVTGQTLVVDGGRRIR
jgi:pteridine reductase